MAMLKVAELGEGDVFLGLAEIDEQDFDSAKHVRAEEFGGHCDNEPLRYTWNREEKRFEPVLNDWDRDFGVLVQRGLQLAAARISEPGAAGEAARDFYRIAARRFPHSVKLHAKKGH